MWQAIWKQQAEEWTYIEFEKEQVPDRLARTPIQPNVSYLHVVLRSMRVVHVRKGLSKFYGAAHSWISLAHAGQGTAEFQVLTTPSQLKDVDAANLDRVITMDRRLLGPTPFRGGDLSLELGLFSIKSADLAGPYLEILQTMSGLAGVSYVSAALPLLAPIKAGINLLAGAEKDSILEIGYSRDAWMPETGYAAVIRVPRGTIDAKSLRIGPDGRLVDAAGAAIRDYPYMVWSVDVTDKRPDWFRIPELKAAFDALNADVLRGDLNAVNSSFAVFRRSALTSPDLLFSDAELIVKDVDQNVRQTMQPIQTGYQSGPTGGLKALEDLTPFGPTTTSPQDLAARLQSMAQRISGWLKEPERKEERQPDRPNPVQAEFERQFAPAVRELLDEVHDAGYYIDSTEIEVLRRSGWVHEALIREMPYELNRLALAIRP